MSKINTNQIRKQYRDIPKTDNNAQELTTDQIDHINFEYDRYTSPEVYQEEAGENNYDILHDIINYIMESPDKFDLIKKIEILSHIIFQCVEPKQEKYQDQYVHMILLRLQGKTYKQIGDIIGKPDSDVIVSLKSLNDAKILMVLKQSSELNQKNKMCGAKRKHKDVY